MQAAGRSPFISQNCRPRVLDFLIPWYEGCLGNGMVLWCMQGVTLVLAYPWGVL